MSQYKVIQDIEAEDKLLGPLTLRQFIYAGITATLLFGAFMVGKAFWALAIPFILPAFAFGFLAAPWGKDQPTETWAVAKVRFLFKPRKRVWDQSGQKELVHITVPKKEVVQYTNGLSQDQVKQRLQVLASTIDTRGWAVKGAAFQQAISFAADPDSDRLTGNAVMPQPVPDYGVQAPQFDVLDEHADVAQKFDQMIASSERTHREQILQKMSAPPDYMHVLPTDGGQLQSTWAPKPQVVGTQPQAATPTTDEATLLHDLQVRDELAEHYENSHMRTIQPIGTSHPSPPATMPADDFTLPAPVPEPVINTLSSKTAVTAPVDPAILDLSRNDDLSVDTLARQAKKKPQDEVVISLH